MRVLIMWHNPGTALRKKDLFPRIGDYDKWAIRWGYGYLPGNTETEKKVSSNKLIIQALKENSRNYFGTYEFGNPSDPRNQTEDLGDDAIAASRYGINNLKFIIQNLPEWTKEENDLNENIDEMYTQLLLQYRRYMGHVAANIGGVYETIRSSEQADAVYEPTPRLKQQEAVKFLGSQLFTTPKWLLSKYILNRTVNPGENDPVAEVQENILASLLRAERLNRLQESVERFGLKNAYGALELFTDVQKLLFADVASYKPVDSYRRKLQNSYVDKLQAMISPVETGSGLMLISLNRSGTVSATDLSRTDIPAIARAQLTTLRKQLAAAIPFTKDKMILNSSYCSCK